MKVAVAAKGSSVRRQRNIANKRLTMKLRGLRLFLGTALIVRLVLPLSAPALAAPARLRADEATEG
jgi:hypothetical protein